MNCEFYNKIKYDLKLPYGGLYHLMTPKLMVTDPELYKYILIKDFDHFVDRGIGESDAKRDPIEGHLFGSKGEYWKRLRNKLSPTFTSGKIKYMFPLIKKCSDQLITTIRKQIGESKQMSLEVKDYCARYTTDVIGSTAFGIEINSLENPDSEFRQVSLLVMKPSVLQMLKAVLSELIPLIKYLNLKIFDPRISQFFSNLVKTNLSYREKNNIKRDDFLNIMMQLQIAQRGKTLSPDDVEMTDDVITAQSFVFFFGGYETSSSVLTFCLYELARNPDIQSKLRQEIMATKKKEGELTYEICHKMSYLDKVTKEALRMYPSLPQLDRISVKKYKLPNTDLTLDVGTKISIPTFAIHYDPEYYPDPEKFDPERFSPENIESRPHYTYLPFGDGPRNCIGMRFGTIQFKIGLAQLISNFEFSIDSANATFEYLKGSILLQT
ncbi:probable cytochrome P450 6a13 isoform X1 [Diaphorina citri]|uniref:Probable cytochrome P450 6a13 isoform X1 n=1 Tax=Diaphorina citri TaxID=121845 RepID=A0A3Q0J2M3_DIACI|nr:probable cytochrome P450 6a13 isoform X1 [Diaphorina citri]